MATTSPSPAPAWLAEEAAAQAERLNDPEPSRWVMMTYTEAHELNVFGCGPHAFDFSAYPDLQPLAL